MERPVCEVCAQTSTEPCRNTSFHTLRQMFLCEKHCPPGERAAWMKVHCTVAPRVCRFNNCGRPAKYQGIKNGDYFCATHAAGLPMNLLKEDMDEPKLDLSVEVSLGSPSQMDLVPVTETANALGRKGYRVYGIRWKDDRPESNRVLLQLELFSGRFAFPTDELTTRQIELLERQYNTALSDWKRENRLHLEVCGRYKQELATSEALRTEVNQLAYDLEQTRFKLQHLLAEGGVETLPMSIDVGEIEE